MLSFSESDKEKLTVYESQNKLLVKKCNEQDDQLKRMVVQIQKLEGQLQLTVRHLKIAPNPGDVAIAKEQESRLEAEIREQIKAKEILERELSILKHAPQLAPKRNVLGRYDTGSNPKSSKSHSSKLVKANVSAQTEGELRRIVNALRDEVESAKQRLSSETEALTKERAILRGKSEVESVTALKIERMEVDLDIKNMEDKEEQIALALRTVKENEHRIAAEVDSLGSQLASQKASVASHQRQKQDSGHCSLGINSVVNGTNFCYRRFWKTAAQPLKQGK
jgi:hypothetical protein